MAVGDNTTDSVLWFPGEVIGKKPGGQSVSPPTGGGAFIGCRYRVCDAIGDPAILGSNGNRNVVPNWLGPVVVDTNGFLVGGNIRAPLSGFYRAAGGGNLASAQPFTMAWLVIGSNDAEPWPDDDDYFRLPAVSGTVLNLQVAREIVYLVAGESIGMYVFGTTAEATFSFKGSFNLTYLGSGTDPDA